MLLIINLHSIEKLANVQFLGENNFGGIIIDIFGHQLSSAGSSQHHMKKQFLPSFQLVFCYTTALHYIILSAVSQRKTSKNGSKIKSQQFPQMIKVNLLDFQLQLLAYLKCNRIYKQGLACHSHFEKFSLSVFLVICMSKHKNKLIRNKIISS